MLKRTRLHENEDNMKQMSKSKLKNAQMSWVTRIRPCLKLEMVKMSEAETIHHHFKHSIRYDDEEEEGIMVGVKRTRW